MSIFSNSLLLWLIAAAGAVAALVFILLFFIRREGSGGHAPGPGEQNRTGREDYSEEAIYMPGRGVAPQEEGPRVFMVDATGLEMPNPERPITDEDAALIDIIRQSPELPSAIIELSRMLRDPAANIKRVVELISTDPVLSAKVLRVVNSAAYGQSRVTSLQQAVVLLGFNNIWLLVTQMLAASSIKPFAQLEKQEMRQLWRHAAAASVCARHLLFSSGLTTSEIAPTVFTCSLLHDVGKFLLRGLGGGGKDTAEDSGTPCESFSVLKEAGIYGLDHCRMGYLLSTYWKLPELICTTIGYHHHPSFGNWDEIPKHAGKTVVLVAMSDLMAKTAGYWDDSPCCFSVPPAALNQAGLDKIKPVNKLLTRELKKDLQQTEALIEAAAEEV